MDKLKTNLLEALYKWIGQRSGMDYRNYGDSKSYRQEARRITKQLHDARILLRQVELSGITGEALLRSFDKRLTVSVNPDTLAVTLDYTTGQYFAVEYRAAVCLALSGALWDWYREDCVATAKEGESPGDAIRRNFRVMFGSSFVKRWLN